MRATRTDLDIAVPGARATDRLAAWRWRPAGEGPFPALVMTHGIGAIRAVRLAEICQRFADAGYIVYAFDYRHFGESGGMPRQLFDPAQQRADIHAVLDAAGADPDVDQDRVALWGTSFGGGLAIQVAAQRPDLAAVIAQCPLMDGLVEAFRMGPVLGTRLGIAATSDRLRSLVGMSPRYVKIAGQPGELAVLNKPHAEEAYLSMVTPGAPWENRVAARTMLGVAGHRPILSAPRVACPALYCICDTDTDVSPGRGHAAAKRTPKGRSIGYPVGHFDIYFGEPLERALADQLAFLAEVMGPHREVGVAAR